MKQIIPSFITLTGAALLSIWPAAVPGFQPGAGANQETSEEILSTTYEEDLAAFKRLRRNLFQLAAEIDARKDLFGPRPMDDPALLQPETRRQIISLWYPILDNYLTLDALAGKYMDFPLMENKEEQKRAFHLARGIFLTQYRAALDIIAELEQNPAMDTILNEANAPLGLPCGIYAHFKYQYLNVIKAGRYAALEAVALIYKTPADSRMAQWAAEDSRVILAAGKGPGPKMTFNNGIAIVKRFGHTAWFPLQKGVAEWMGKTKVWRRHHYLIEPEQIRMLSGRLEPGDILLERREWYLTNVGIPGFWTHAALFVGSPDQRKALSQDPEVKQWLNGQNAKSIDDLIRIRYPKASAALHKPYKDGRLPQVIEAISPGVSLTSLHHSATCDSLAVLRPRLSKTDRVAAVVRAMRYYGRPYDYDFDFISDGSLVCTELVVKSYLPGDMKQGLQLPFEKVMGQMVTPANAFVQQFDTTFGTPAQQMDMVLFLDGNEKEKFAVEADVEAFRGSWNRPKWHILVEYAPMMQKPEQE
jgi:hypothetical protein